MSGTGRSGRQLRRAVATLAVLLVALVAVAPGSDAAVAVAPGSATTAAVASATGDGRRVAVAVTDTTTGTTTTAGEADALFPSESVVKVLIAARLLVDGPLTGEVAEQATRMLTSSDDDAASTLWGLVGGPDVVAWAAERYDVAGLAAPSEWGWWGNTKVSATGLVALYTALAADPLVAPWLTARLAAMTPTADDGTDQTFGFGAAATTGDAAVKQGWGGDDDAESTANLLSTGYVDAGRYAVAVIVQDPGGGATTALVPAIDAVAAGVLTDVDAVRAAETADAAEDAAAQRAGCAGATTSPR